METKYILLAVFLPLGIIILILLFLYLFGNVYNGLVRRQMRVRHSRYELDKLLHRSFNLIPSLIRDLPLSDKQHADFADIYRQYKSIDLDSASLPDVASLDYTYQQALKSVFESYEERKDSEGKEEPTSAFAEESRRLLDFSIPLYNHNVRDYMRFRSLIVNRTVARIFGFSEAEGFSYKPVSGTTTLDFRIRGIINGKGKS